MANLVQVFFDKDTGEFVLASGGTNSGGGGTSLNVGFEHIQELADVTWVVSHNKGSTKLLCQVFDVNLQQVIPGEIHIVDSNTVVITFPEPFNGRAHVLFF